MGTDRWTPRGQGDAGEASAIAWVLGRGGTAFVAAGHTPADYDFIAYFGEGLLRVQVKTSTQAKPDGRFVVSLCTRGGNRSWNGVIKYMDPSRCDFVFAHVGDGRRWFIPTRALEAKTSVTLGGGKYSEYEIERGRALLSRMESGYYTR